MSVGNKKPHRGETFIEKGKREKNERRRCDTKGNDGVGAFDGRY